MSNSIYYATEVPLPFEQAWALFDFPAEGWTLSGGGPREIGTIRQMEAPGMGLIVDELAAYERSADRCSYTYRLINDDNFLGATGYEGTVTLHRNVQNPSRCFYIYCSRWAAANPEAIAALPGMFAGMMDQMLAGTAG